MPSTLSVHTRRGLAVVLQHHCGMYRVGATQQGLRSGTWQLGRVYTLRVIVTAVAITRATIKILVIDTFYIVRSTSSV